jgi:hypothetical protein
MAGRSRGVHVGHARLILNPQCRRAHHAGAVTAAYTRRMTTTVDVRRNPAHRRVAARDRTKMAMASMGG